MAVYRDNPRYIIVGEAPSLFRNQPGLTFGGKSRPVFEEFLKELGVTREDVYSTNMAHCIIPEEQAGDLDACLPFLKEEISMINCSHVILMGRPVVKRMLGEDYPLSGYSVNYLGKTYYCIWHPMSVVYRPEMYETYIQAARKIKDAESSVRTVMTLDKWFSQ